MITDGMRNISHAPTYELNTCFAYFQSQNMIKENNTISSYWGDHLNALLIVTDITTSK